LNATEAAPVVIDESKDDGLLRDMSSLFDENASDTTNFAQIPEYNEADLEAVAQAKFVAKGVKRGRKRIAKDVKAWTTPGKPRKKRRILPDTGGTDESPCFPCSI